MPRTAQLATFIAMVLSVLGAVHWSVWVRLVVDPAPPAAVRRGLTLALIVLFLGIPITFYFARLRDLAARRFRTMPGYVWLGAVFILLVLIVGTDLVRLTGAAVERLVADVPPSDPERRVSVARLFAFAIALVGGGTTVAALRSGLGPV